MKQNAILASLSAVLSAVLLVLGCQPQSEPVKCVCNCEGPLPEGAKVTVVSGGDTPPAAQASASTPTPPAPPRPTPEPPRPSPPSPRKASGQVGAEPGSGIPVQLDDVAKKEMKDAMVGLGKGAKGRDLAEMRKFTTERLGESLAKAVEQHGDRLFRRTDVLAAGVESGEVVVEQTNDIGDGNYDVLFKFANGESAHLLMFKEEGRWVFNRL